MSIVVNKFNVKQILDSIQKAKPKIVVVGDLMLDHYINGTVDRISPEAPVPVVRNQSERDMLGGCGNVVRNLHNLGAQTSVVSLIGDDAAGEQIRKNLARRGISSEYLLTSATSHTTRKMRVIADRQQVVRVDWDSTGLAEAEVEVFLQHLTPALADAEGIVVSDYGKGVCRSAIIKACVASAAENEIPLFIDPKGLNWNKYAGAGFITPNTKEAGAVLNSRLIKNEDFEFAGEAIGRDYQIANCLITRGKDGMSFINADQALHIPSRAREVFDVSGAGDTVIASLAAAVCSGISTENSIHFANHAAGIVVGHVGTAAITADELRPAGDGVNPGGSP